MYLLTTKTAYIDPRDWIDLLPRAFKDIIPHVTHLYRACGRLDMTRQTSFEHEKNFFPPATNIDP
jgi:hypothetical protein